MSIFASTCNVTASVGSFELVNSSLRAEDEGERGVGGKAPFMVSNFSLVRREVGNVEKSEEKKRE
jgi:hypothetical protein